ncbi:hypothetical protein QQZ08_002362 [Neonectria magnoliae]|uniref:RanBD1 domain-containing protein n=1 Tax=Neonectria magnoliae TaxID=2732573 RepID=A0ABR1IC03_9HYPO
MDLERTAIDQIQQICNGQATKMKDPRESTVPSTMSQRSTILTLEEEEPEAAHVSDSDDTVVPERKRSRSSSSTTERQNTGPASLPESERQATSPPPPEKVVRFDSNPVLRSAVSVVTPVCEKKEEPVPCDENKQWRSVESGGTDVLRFHGSLNLHIEYTTERPADGSKPLRFSVRRMSEEESSTVWRRLFAMLGVKS